MEVFNSLGEPGVAVIEMDNKQAIRLEFQYRINISIIQTNQSTKLDLLPLDAQNDNRNMNFSNTRNNLNENVDIFQTESDSLANNCGNVVGRETVNDFSSRIDKVVLTSVEIQNSSTPVICSDTWTSGGNKKSKDIVMGNNDREGILESMSNMKDSKTQDCNVKVEGDTSLNGFEEEDEISPDLDDECEDDKFHHADSQDGSENTDNSVFPCSICHKVFKSSQAFVEHKKALTKRIKCLVCKEECFSRAHLMLHDYVAHTSQGNLSKKLYKECPLCLEPFFNDSDLVTHIKIKHTFEGIYQCCLCHKVLQSDSEYESHTDVCKRKKSNLKLIKSNNKQFACAKGRSTCQQSNTKLKRGLPKSSKRQLDEIKSEYGENKKSKRSSSLAPEYASMKSKSSTKISITLKKQDVATAKLKKSKLNAQYYLKLKRLKMLRKQREAEEKATKGDGPVILIQKSNLTDEKDSSWDKTWKCKFCARIFMTMREFNCHIKPMGTKRVCTKCGDRSKSKAEYLIHQCKKEQDGDKVHHGIKKCPVCEEEMPKKEILKHVMSQHTGEMSYLCCICGIPLESYESWVSHCDSNHSPDNESSSNKNRLFTDVSFTSHHNDNEIVCKLCKSYFHNEKDFVHHYKFETVKKVCEICETPSFTEAGYIVHRYISHGLSPEENHSLPIPSSYNNFNKDLWEEDKFDIYCDGSPENVKCPCCPDIVHTKDLFFHVMAVHTKESPFKCCACESVSETLTHYIEHCNFHLGKRMYNNKTPRCLQCDLRFESRRALNSHKQFHQKRCPYCQMEFSSAVFLKIHLQNSHTNEMEACSFCGKLFACSTQLAEHERHHYFSKQSQCTVCGKLIFARNMAKHMKIAHPKSDDDLFFCNVCKKRFRDRHQMEQHQLCHSTDFTHECDVCRKKFKNAIRLREHAKVHLDKKRLFVCDVCGKTCTERYNLQVHMRVHSSTKEFHCPVCSQGFNYNQSLKSHMEKEHNKVSVGPQHFNCSFCNIPFGYVHTLEAHMREKHGYSTTNYGPASQWYP